ncbi:DUF427 domain-containing protein [Shinella sp. M31]|uniref:DUF427 domain-containing protein n=1 Tax=Shinella sp. M31 TaxID=3368615 RepID=UPI003B9DCB88
MSDRPILIPNDNHRITIERSKRRVIVKAEGIMIADSTRALMLSETNHSKVFYIPRADIDASLLARSDHSTYCPYKGDASYFSIPAAGERGVNAIWSYENPFLAAAEVKDHLAFYADRVDVIEVDD